MKTSQNRSSHKSHRKFGNRLANRRSLKLEGLETRKLMAADVNLVNGTLYVEGTADTDVVEVSEATVNGQSVYQATVKDINGNVLAQDSFNTADVDSLLVDGQDGNDIIVNNTSLKSTLLGGAGDDIILGGKGDDFVLAGEGNDFVMAGEGNDTVYGGAGYNQLYGEAGNDYIQGGEGWDDIYGGAGD